MTLAQASAGMAAIARQLAATYPENKDIVAASIPFIDEHFPAADPDHVLRHARRPCLG